MFRKSSLESTFECLYGMFKPVELILVGTSIASWKSIVIQLDVNSVHYIDADEEQVVKLRSLPTLSSKQIFHHALLYKESTQIPFYKLSNPTLNGTLSGEVLSKIWGNIKTIKSTEVNATSLDELLKISVGREKWIVIECLNSLDILKGASNLLKNTEVVMARTIIDDNRELESISKEQLDAWMNLKGYVNIAFFEENNPRVGMSLYVKDYKSLAKELNVRKQENQKELEQEKQNKAKELDAFNKILQEKQKASQALVTQLKLIKQENQKELEQEKQNKIKELDVLNKKLEEKQKANEVLITQLKEQEGLKKDIYLYKKMNNYYIKPDYISRTEYTHYNDQDCKDEWQLEVYLHALGLMKKHNLKKIVDIGCGSGYKLMKYFKEYKTIGLELGINLKFLNKKYPLRTWLESDFDINPKIKTDVLICSDVIEHIVNPDDLIKYIKKMKFKYLVLSTPDRDLVYEDGSEFLNGPPRNLAHIREWSFDEFKEYISKHFKIIDHRVTNMGQSTQTIICQKY